MNTPPVQPRQSYPPLFDVLENDVIARGPHQRGGQHEGVDGPDAGEESGTSPRADTASPSGPDASRPDQAATGNTGKPGLDHAANAPDPRSAQAHANVDKPAGSAMANGHADGRMPNASFNSGFPAGAAQSPGNPLGGLFGQSRNSLGDAIGQLRLGVFESQLANVSGFSPSHDNRVAPLTSVGNPASVTIGGTVHGLANTPSPKSTAPNAPLSGSPAQFAPHSSSASPGSSGGANVNRDGFALANLQGTRFNNPSAPNSVSRSGAHEETVVPAAQNTGSRQSNGAADILHAAGGLRGQASNDPVNQATQNTPAAAARSSASLSPIDQKVAAVNTTPAQSAQPQRLGDDGTLYAPIAGQRGQVSDGQEASLDSLSRGYVLNADGSLRLRMQGIDGVQPLSINELDAIDEQSMANHGELSTHDLIWKVVVPAFVGVGTLLGGASLGVASAAGATGMSGAFLLVAAAGILGYGGLRGAANLRELADTGISIDPRVNSQCRTEWIATGAQSIGSLVSLAFLLI